MNILEIVFPQLVLYVLVRVVQFMYQTANYLFTNFEFIILPDGKGKFLARPALRFVQNGEGGV
jgi:hypothetical protein